MKPVHHLITQKCNQLISCVPQCIFYKTVLKSNENICCRKRYPINTDGYLPNWYQVLKWPATACCEYKLDFTLEKCFTFTIYSSIKTNMKPKKSTEVEFHCAWNSMFLKIYIEVVLIILIYVCKTILNIPLNLASANIWLQQSYRECL